LEHLELRKGVAQRERVEARTQDDVLKNAGGHRRREAVLGPAAAYGDESAKPAGERRVLRRVLPKLGGRRAGDREGQGIVEDTWVIEDLVGGSPQSHSKGRSAGRVLEHS